MIYKKEKILFILLAFIILIPIKSLLALDPLISSANVNNFSPENLVDINGTLFFSAIDKHGRELWKFDKNLNKAVLVRDINLNGGSDLSNFVEYKGVLYFSANDGINGNRLWKSDGTEVGTIMLKNEIPLLGDFPSKLSVVNNVLYFIDRGTEEEDWGIWRAWKTDGTVAGTRIITDQDLGSPNFSKFIGFNNEVYFMENNNTAKIWKYDGINYPTVIKVLGDGLECLFKSGDLFYAGQDLLSNFFCSSQDTTYLQIWKTDLSGNTGLLADNIYISDSNLLEFNNNFYFSAVSLELGTELWKYDTSLGQILLVKDINPGLDSTISYLTVFSGNIYFSADGGSGKELWVSDGTEQGTLRFKDKFPGISSNLINPENLNVFNGFLYFTLNEMELWRTDGTEAGTVLFKTFPSPNSTFFSYFTSSSGKLFFELNNEINTRLWQSDGTLQGTNQVDFSISATDFIVSAPTENYINIDNSLYFFTQYYSGESTGYRLWKSDLDGNNSQYLTEIWGGYPDNLTSIGGKLYFRVDSYNDDGDSIWKSDGTFNGTKQLILYGSGRNISDLINVGKKIYFSMPYEGQYFLYEIDVNTNKRPFYINAFSDININSFIGLNGSTYFSADNNFWKYSLEFGLELIKNLNVSQIKKVGNLMYFTTDYSDYGMELWKSDGTEEGTAILKDIYPGIDDFEVPNSSNPNNFIDVNGILYFFANHANGFGLWKTDGTEQGTILVKNITDESGIFSDFVGSVDKTLYFSITDGALRGRNELWKSDGTEAGTEIINYALESGLFPYKYYKAGNSIYVVITSDMGMFLYRVYQGTLTLIDVNEGQASYPDNFSEANGTLYFMAINNVYGKALYKIEKNRFSVYEFSKTGAFSSVQQLKQVDPVKALTYRDYWENGIYKYLEQFHSLSGYSLKKFKKLEPVDYTFQEICENAGFYWLESGRCEYTPSHFVDQNGCENVGYHWVFYSPDCINYYNVCTDTTDWQTCSG